MIAALWILRKYENPFKIEIGICCDLRFNEWTDIYRQRGCSMVIYHAAFNTTTGLLHWEILQTARAADNQTYIASGSPARDLRPSFCGYPAYGHSMVTNPWAVVLDQLDENESDLVTEIELDSVQRSGGSFPVSLRKKRLCRAQKTDRMNPFTSNRSRFRRTPLLRDNSVNERIPK